MFWRDCFAMARDFLGSFLPAFLFRLYLTKNVLIGSLTFFPTALIFVAVFPHSMRTRELNRGNRRKMLVLFFRFYYYQLTLSCSDFSKCFTS